MNTKLRTAWTVAAVLAVLLIIMTIMWGRASGVFTLDAGDLERQREEIAEACGDQIDTPACRDALDDLARLLARFERQIDRESDDAESGATTTVEVGQ